MDIRLACADFTFPLLEHDAALRLIQSMGFQGVDIGLFEGRSHLQPTTEFGHPERSGRALGAKLADMGLQAADIFLQLDPDFVPFALNHPETERRARARGGFEQALIYAAASGCAHMTVLPGVYFASEPRADSYGRMLDELAWRLELAQTHDIVFSVEAHVGSIVPSPQTAADLVERLPGLTLTLDYTHFTRQGLPDLVCEPLLEHASHFHFRGARANRLQASFAENTIDYGRVLDAMDEVSYPGWHAIEYVWIDWEHCNECDNVSETIRFRDFILAHGRP